MFTGCTGGVGKGEVLSDNISSGGGHGGKGGDGCYNGSSCIEGGMSYGDADLPCELGSGSGNDSSLTAGGGILGELSLSNAWFSVVYFDCNN